MPCAAFWQDGGCVGWGGRTGRAWGRLVGQPFPFPAADRVGGSGGLPPRASAGGSRSRERAETTAPSAREKTTISSRYK